MEDKNRRVARFQPKRSDNIRAEWMPFIGAKATWHYAGHGDDDESYPSQTRWITTSPGWPAHWVPDEDLQDVWQMFSVRKLRLIGRNIKRRPMKHPK